MAKLVERDRKRQAIMNSRPSYNIWEHQGSRMTDDEYKSLKDEIDATEMANKYGNLGGGWLSMGHGNRNFGNPELKKKYGLSSYGEDWSYYPLDVQRELVRMMNNSQEMRRQNVSNGGEWDGMDLEAANRIRAKLYPANAQYWNNYADFVRENNMRVGRNRISDYQVKKLAEQGITPEEYFSSNEFKDGIFNAELNDVEKQLNVGRYPDELDIAYREMLDANRANYNNMRQDAFDGYLVD